MKKYELKVVEILENGDAVIEFPDEVINELGWNVGDEIQISTDDDKIILKKIDDTTTTD